MSRAALVASASAAVFVVLPSGRVTAASVTRLAGVRTVARLQSAASVSTNWAGYAVTSPGTSYTSVTATWIQPKATCASGAGSAESAFWVGLGGYAATSQALEQIGTDSDCSPLGRPAYFAWYELVPAPSVNLGIKILPGNTVTVSVNAIDGGTTMELQLIDRSRGTRVTKLIPVSSPDLSSAEWIAEAPAECSNANLSCETAPLADFGSVSFTRIAALGNGAGGTATDPSWSLDQIALEPSPAHRSFFPGPDSYGGVADSTSGATPGALSSGGRTFSVAWVANANPGLGA